MFSFSIGTAADVAAAVVVVYLLLCLVLCLLLCIARTAYKQMVGRQATQDQQAPRKLGVYLEITNQGFLLNC